MKLSNERFGNVVKDAILVSIDLLILNERNEVLLGRRKNAPARGYYFVPGGRIYKGESPEEAFRRIARSELGVEFEAAAARLHGIYRHSYAENCFGDPKIGGTEYVVIACLLRVQEPIAIRTDDQHEDMRFFSMETVLTDPRVHEFTKNYFSADPPNAFLGGDGVDLLAPTR